MSGSVSAGDLVSRRKGILFRHFGVYLGSGRVLHNFPGRGEHVSTLAEFGVGGVIQVHPVTAEKRQWVLRNAYAVLANPQGYELFTNNCEHTVNRIANGSNRSPQLQVVIICLIMIALVRAGSA